MWPEIAPLFSQRVQVYRQWKDAFEDYQEALAEGRLAYLPIYHQHMTRCGDTLQDISAALSALALPDEIHALVSEIRQKEDEKLVHFALYLLLRDNALRASLTGVDVLPTPPPLAPHLLRVLPDTADAFYAACAADTAQRHLDITHQRNAEIAQKTAEIRQILIS